MDSLRKHFDRAVDEFSRPALILICCMLLFNLPILLYKFGLLLKTVQYLLFCNDKKWRKPMDPGAIFGPHLSAGKVVQRKTIYFIRHGESTWNDTFNKGQHRSAVVFILGFVPGIIKAVVYELYLLLSGKLDSWFYDSPLSYLGLKQVEELAVFLEKGTSKAEEDTVKIIQGQPGAPSSRILCSNLRRAISTVAGGLRDRFSRRPADKIFVLSSLQEISRNPDALSITPTQTPVQASWIEKTSTKVCNFQEIFATQVDTSRHTGNKPVNSNGLVRMEDFCKHIFSTAVREEHVIVGGHSLWFRSFFDSYLPYSVNHQARKKKIQNGGVVAFELLHAKTQYGDKYMVDPKTIRVVYLGF